MDTDKAMVLYCLGAVEKWQLMIKDLKLENSRLKDKLSEALHHKDLSSFMDQAEYFQQRFIEKDQVLDLFRQDILSLRDMLDTKGMTKAGTELFLLLKSDLKKIVLEFQQLKKIFFDFILSTGS